MPKKPTCVFKNPTTKSKEMLHKLVHKVLKTYTNMYNKVENESPWVISMTIFYSPDLQSLCMTGEKCNVYCVSCNANLDREILAKGWAQLMFKVCHRTLEDRKSAEVEANLALCSAFITWEQHYVYLGKVWESASPS